MSRNYSSTRRALTTSLLMIALLMLIATVLWAQGGSGEKSVGFVDVLLLPRVWVSVIFCLVGLALLMKSWVCPIGAVQEISHRIPLPEKLKVTLPFRITNTIRTGIFVVFVVVVFLAGKSVYDHFNPFEFLHWGFEATAIAAFAATLIVAMFMFRPFCYLICPLGLITWVLEHASLVKVKVDSDLCTRCDICVHLSHCPAVPSILEGRRSRPDCHACGRCLEVCPEGALAFRK